MDRLIKFGKRLLFPGWAVVALCVPAATALLIYVFCSGREDTPLAYGVYGFSAYALSITCAAIFRRRRNIQQAVSSGLQRSAFLRRYRTDIPFRMQVSLNLSLGSNLLYACIKLGYGIHYQSTWFICLSIYYGTLALMRFVLLRYGHRRGFGQDVPRELKQYRLCGGILVAMHLALAGIVFLVVHQEQGFTYPGYFIYVMAIYAFYNVITAVIDIVRYRKYHSPVMSAAKIVKLAAAMVSILSLETAMLAQFGSQEDVQFRKMMSSLTGAGVCLGVLALAVGMLVSANRQLRQLPVENCPPQDQA